MTDKKPREFWIDVVKSSDSNIGDVYDNQIYEDLIHVIEKSAYDQLEAQLAVAVEDLNRIVGMVEIWTDEHGQRKTEEIYASKIAREALVKIKALASGESSETEQAGGK